MKIELHVTDRSREERKWELKLGECLYRPREKNLAICGRKG